MLLLLSLLSLLLMSLMWLWVNPLSVGVVAALCRWWFLAMFGEDCLFVYCLLLLMCVCYVCVYICVRGREIGSFVREILSFERSVGSLFCWFERDPLVGSSLDSHPNWFQPHANTFPIAVTTQMWKGPHAMLTTCWSGECSSE